MKAVRIYRTHAEEVCITFTNPDTDEEQTVCFDTDDIPPMDGSDNTGPTDTGGGSSPTNSSSDNCEGSGCIDHEESYDPGGPEECRYLRYDSKSGAHGYSAWSQSHNACVQNVVRKESLVASAHVVNRAFNEACSKWNDYQNDPNKSKWEAVNQALKRAAAGASLAMICATPLGELPPAAAGAATFCGAMGAAYPEILDAICQ